MPTLKPRIVCGYLEINGIRVAKIEDGIYSNDLANLEKMVMDFYLELQKAYEEGYEACLEGEPRGEKRYG